MHHYLATAFGIIVILFGIRLIRRFKKKILGGLGVFLGVFVLVFSTGLATKLLQYYAPSAADIIKGEHALAHYKRYHDRLSQQQATTDFEAAYRYDKAHRPKDKTLLDTDKGLIKQAK